MKIKDQLIQILKNQREELSIHLSDLNTALNPKDLQLYAQTQNKIKELIDTGLFLEQTTIKKEEPIVDLEIENKKTINHATFQISLHGGIFKHRNGTPDQIVSQAFIYINELEHDDQISYIKLKDQKKDPFEITDINRPKHPKSNKFKEVDCPIKYDNQSDTYFIDEDVNGDSLESLTSIPKKNIQKEFINAKKLKINDILTMRFDSHYDKPILKCIWITYADTPKQTKTARKNKKIKNQIEKENLWSFDLNQLKIAIIGGNLFHSAWKKTIVDSNGCVEFSKSEKIKANSTEIEKLIEKNDVILIAKNMMNHPAANAVKKTAKTNNKPCESFEGFSANQIFNTIKVLKERGQINAK